MRQWGVMDCGRLGKCSWTVGGELESHYMGRLAFATRRNFCSLILSSVSSPAFENLMRTTDLFSYRRYLAISLALCDFKAMLKENC
jgi:hypothetical protein